MDTPFDYRTLGQATGETDTLFGFSISRSEILILMLVIAGILFFIILKIYDVYKHRYWCERPNRVNAVKDVLYRCNKNIKELDKEDLIDNNLITLYEYYDRSVEKCVSDLCDEFKEPKFKSDESKTISP
jgi:hypothetical protein